MKDTCHPHGTEFSEEYATYTQDQCLKICETRMVTGGEYRDVPPNPECILHTKYIIDARGHQPGDEKYICWKFERSTYDSCLTISYDSLKYLLQSFNLINEMTLTPLTLNYYLYF